MRDYPSVPNVFRVASSHSINNMGVTATPLGNNTNISNISSGCNSSSNNNNNNNNNKQQQANGHVANNNNSSVIMPARSNSYEQQQQQQQRQAMHQLTTTASIERSSFPPTQGQQEQQQQQQLQHSPYATLPRGPRQLQQLRAQSGSGSSSQDRTSAPQQPPNTLTPLRQQMGVINTISGSIPATGFATLTDSLSDLQSNKLQHNNNNSNINQNSSSNNNTATATTTNSNNNIGNCSSSNYYNNTGGRRQREAREQLLQEQQHAPLMAAYKSIERQQRPNTALNGASGLGGGLTTMASVSGGYLWLLTPVAASISVAIVIAALAGPQWLFTEEKLPNVNYNGTANFNALDDGAYITKYTKSSLWILCTTMPGLDMDTYNCIKIDYFPKEGYQPDPHDSTPAIPYTVTKSCPIFLAAGIFLLISFIVFLIPTCSHQNNLYYFSAGILFIVSGLVMLIGLIAYISILKAEIGSKLRPRSTLQPALFKVTYGQSFFLFVFGFIATEFVGVLNIFLYINLQEVSYYSRLPCFSISSIQEKVKEGQHPLSHSYKRYKQPGGAIAGHTVAVSQTRRQQQHQQQEHQQEQQHGRHAGLRTGPANGRLHQVHDVSANVGLAQTPPTGYVCRKHPNLLGPGDGSNLNLYLHNDLERRFYFEKPAVSKCNLHSRSFAKSLNELCTEMTPPAVPPPPPPSAVRMSVGAANAKLSQQTFADLPQEFPLTRSVSTTTDIYTSAPPQQQQLERRSRRNMATNTVPVGGGRGGRHVEMEQPRRIRYSRDMDIDEDATEEQARRLCGLKRGIRKTKDELFQEFCKRAGVRSKPKNIYYIASDEATFPSQQTRSRRSVGSRNEDEHIDYDHEDDDADGDEHGFKRFRSGAPIEEEQLYLPGDRQQATQFPRGLAPPAASSSHQHRRASMCVDPPSQLPPVGHLRKLNSNLSLHMPLHADRQSLYDLDRCDSTSFDVWPGTHFGGSQSRLPQDYGVPAPALAPTQSRTLPRCFLRQPATGMGVAGSQESFGSLQSNFSASQQRFSQLMMQHQQQLQQQNRFLSTLTLHKPAEEVNPPPATALPKAGNNLQQAAVHWPAAIPSSPSNYRSSGYQVYAPAVSGIGGGTALHPPPAKFQRAYAFDDQQRRPSFAINDAFDLDEIERERRRSHASLFGGATTQEQYDLINGTAV